MYYVYIIKSIKNGSLYIGCTGDLQKRFKMHNQGMSFHTKKYVPWILVYYEAYRSKTDAYNREGALKLHAQGLRRLKERLLESLR